MKIRTSILNKFFEKELVNSLPTINDLREKEFNGETLTEKEALALANFDRFRIAELNAQMDDDMAFHKRYRELHVMANLGDYEEFLKEKYC